MKRAYLPGLAQAWIWFSIAVIGFSNLCECQAIVHKTAIAESAKSPASAVSGSKDNMAAKSKAVAAAAPTKAYVCRIVHMTGPLAGDRNKKPQYYYSAAFESNQDSETLSSAFVKYLFTQYGVRNEVDGPSRHSGGGCWTVDSWKLSDAQAFIDKELLTSANNHKPPVSWPDAVTTSWAYSGNNNIEVAPTKRATEARASIPPP